MLKKHCNKRTRIVVTLGPATHTYEEIKDLVIAGANMFRANTSHGTLEDHLEEIKTIRKVAKELDLFLPIMIDLQGPKIRSLIRKLFCRHRVWILIIIL
jgi:pyruvate kinase